MLRESGLLTAPDHPRAFPTGGFKEKVKARITMEIRNIGESVFSISYSWGMGEISGKGVLKFEEVTEAPEL